MLSDECDGDLEFGTRVVPAAEIHTILKERPKNYSPSVTDLAGGQTTFGWSLDYFVAELLLGCKMGYVYEGIQDENIFNLFNRRTGAIAAALAIVIDQPEG